MDNKNNEKNKKQLIGEVVESGMEKTAVVKVVRRFPHPVYKKFINKTKKYYAHDPSKLCGIGDTVLIEESKPLSKLKRYDESIKCYKHSLQIKPHDKLVKINMISAYRKIGRIDDALKLCNKILEKNPDELIVLYHKLRLLKKSNKIRESNEICNHILKKYPSNTDVLNELIR